MNSIEDDSLKMKIEYCKVKASILSVSWIAKICWQFVKAINKGSEYANQRCDTRKGNQELSINPAEPALSIHVYPHKSIAIHL